MYESAQKILQFVWPHAKEFDTGFDLLSPTVDYDVTIIETPMNGEAKEVTFYERRDQPVFYIGEDVQDDSGFPIKKRLGLFDLDKDIIEDWEFWTDATKYSHFICEPIEAYRYEISIALDLIVNRKLPDTAYRFQRCINYANLSTRCEGVYWNYTDYYTGIQLPSAL